MPAFAGGNASESLASLKAMAKDASELHATAFPPASARLQLLLWLPLAQSEVMLVKGQRLSQVEEVQRNALETASPNERLPQGRF